MKKHGPLPHILRSLFRDIYIYCDHHEGALEEYVCALFALRAQQFHVPRQTAVLCCAAWIHGYVCVSEIYMTCHLLAAAQKADRSIDGHRRSGWISPYRKDQTRA